MAAMIAAPIRAVTARQVGVFGWCVVLPDGQEVAIEDALDGIGLVIPDTFGRPTALRDLQQEIDGLERSLDYAWKALNTIAAALECPPDTEIIVEAFKKRFAAKKENHR